jgi:hypothetical protein
MSFDQPREVEKTRATRGFFVMKRFIGKENIFHPASSPGIQ